MQSEKVRPLVSGRFRYLIISFISHFLMKLTTLCPGNISEFIAHNFPQKNFFTNIKKLGQTFYTVSRNHGIITPN